MRKILFLFMIVLLFSLFLLFSNSNVTIGRVWIDSTGKHKTDAEFVSLSEDGQTVTLKKPDGKETRIPYKNLSTRDQTYIQGLLKSQGKKSGDGAGGEADSEEASQTYPQREWSDNMGRRSLKAAFVSVSDGWDSIVTFKKDSGRTVKLFFDELSLEDQSYIQEIFESQNTADDKETGETDGKPVVGWCRDWQNSKGDQTMVASFLSLSEDEKTVLIQKRCGQRVKIPFSEFSSEDQKYIQSIAKIPTANGYKTGAQSDEVDDPLYGDKFLEIPFNPYVKTLPENFQGHDIKQLWDALQIDGKGEFESIADYRERLNDLRKKPLFGTVFLDSYFAVQGYSDGKYNADREVFHVSLPNTICGMRKAAYENAYCFFSNGRRVDTIDRASLYASIIDVDATDLGTYTGVNGFGAEREITEDAVTGYLLTFYNPRITPSQMDSDNRANDIVIHIPKDKAKQANIKYLYVFKLSPFFGMGKPYTYKSYDHEKPTFDDPNERHYLIQGIYVKKLTWMLYDEQTGEIFTKIPIRGIQEVKIGLLEPV